jgi:hypothetical protein
MTPILAVIQIGGLFEAFIFFVVAGLIFWACWWFLDWVGLPEPFNKFAKVILGLFALIVVVNILLSLVGKQFIQW